MLLLARPAGPSGKDNSRAANPEVSRLGWLHTSQILEALSVRSAVTPPRHFLLSARRVLKPLCKLVEMEISSFWVLWGFAILYPISSSGT